MCSTLLQPKSMCFKVFVGKGKELELYYDTWYIDLLSCPVAADLRPLREPYAKADFGVEGENRWSLSLYFSNLCRSLGKKCCIDTERKTIEVPTRMLLRKRFWPSIVFCFACHGLTAVVALSWIPVLHFYRNAGKRRVLQCRQALSDSKNPHEYSQRNAFRVWNPLANLCRGHPVFRKLTATIMLRDVAINRRHNPVKELEINRRGRAGPCRRVIFQVSVEPGVTTAYPGPTSNSVSEEPHLPNALFWLLASDQIPLGAGASTSTA